MAEYPTDWSKWTCEQKEYAFEHPQVFHLQTGLFQALCSSAPHLEHPKQTWKNYRMGILETKRTESTGSEQEEEEKYMDDAFYFSEEEEEERSDSQKCPKQIEEKEQKCDQIVLYARAGELILFRGTAILSIGSSFSVTKREWRDEKFVLTYMRRPGFANADSTVEYIFPTSSSVGHRILSIGHRRGEEDVWAYLGNGKPNEADPAKLYTHVLCSTLSIFYVPAADLYYVTNMRLEGSLNDPWTLVERLAIYESKAVVLNGKGEIVAHVIQQFNSETEDTDVFVKRNGTLCIAKYATEEILHLPAFCTRVLVPMLENTSRFSPEDTLSFFSPSKQEWSEIYAILHEWERLSALAPCSDFAYFHQ